ncbi:hypothetical protein D9Q98_003705 [Chlorella vulgaris]|uniref:Uncharacterized protein n=1 Tax=Chlorella vulgaris TaxID=3077 RepID=A0A9D4TT43_CHLVU|nr:hypothetical protein D9Q98_003705 [Chlorella vulgaris]
MHSLRCTPPAAASAAADAAESAVASCTGCVASVTAVPSGTRAVLGEQPLGSGIVWDSQGFIVVPYAPLTRVQRQGTAGDPQVFVTLTAADGSVCQRLPASIVSKDASHELVVLQIVPPAGGLRPVVLASSSAVRVGQDAYLLAALPDGSPSIAAGVVSGLGRTIPASNNQAISGVVQSDAEVNAQSLGGALLDAAGSLVGMPVVSFIKPGSGRSSGVNFALPSDLLLEVVPRLIVYGSAAVRR